jgi:hypothetical protein
LRSTHAPDSLGARRGRRVGFFASAIEKTQVKRHLPIPTIVEANLHKQRGRRERRPLDPSIPLRRPCGTRQAGHAVDVCSEATRIRRGGASRCCVIDVEGLYGVKGRRKCGDGHPKGLPALEVAVEYAGAVDSALRMVQAPLPHVEWSGTRRLPRPTRSVVCATKTRKYSESTNRCREEATDSELHCGRPSSPMAPRISRHSVRLKRSPTPERHIAKVSGRTRRCQQTIEASAAAGRRPWALGVEQGFPGELAAIQAYPRWTLINGRPRCFSVPANAEHAKWQLARLPQMGAKNGPRVPFLPQMGVRLARFPRLALQNLMRAARAARVVALREAGEEVALDCHPADRRCDTAC